MKQANEHGRHERLVFTPEEKKALCFLCGALVLGALTTEYRARHARALRPPEAAVHVRTASPHPPRSKLPVPTPTDERTDDE